MLPKIHRITKKKDFDDVFHKGRGVKKGFLFCKISANKMPTHRFGFVVSKKISSKATVRNKVKRRLRAAVASLFLNDKTNAIARLKAHYDIIIVALPGIEKEDFAQINNAVQKLINF